MKIVNFRKEVFLDQNVIWGHFRLNFLATFEAIFADEIVEYFNSAVK